MPVILKNVWTCYQKMVEAQATNVILNDHSKAHTDRTSKKGLSPFHREFNARSHLIQKLLACKPLKHGQLQCSFLYLKPQTHVLILMELVGALSLH